MASDSAGDVSRTLKTPETLKAPIWRNFGFREIEGTNELDKSKAVCKKCGIQVKHCGNTTNLKNHLRRHHPNLSAFGPQQTKLDMLSLLPINSSRSQKITEAMRDSFVKICGRILSLKTTASGS